MTLLANSESAAWTAMLGGKPHSKPRCLIGFWASSGLIVDFANSVVLWRHPEALVDRELAHAACDYAVSKYDCGEEWSGLRDFAVERYEKYKAEADIEREHGGEEDDD
jgi:hypothetical protein